MKLTFRIVQIIYFVNEIIVDTEEAYKRERRFFSLKTCLKQNVNVIHLTITLREQCDQKF